MPFLFITIDREVNDTFKVVSGSASIFEERIMRQRYLCKAGDMSPGIWLYLACLLISLMVGNMACAAAGEKAGTDETAVLGSALDGFRRGVNDFSKVRLSLLPACEKQKSDALPLVLIQPSIRSLFPRAFGIAVETVRLTVMGSVGILVSPVAAIIANTAITIFQGKNANDAGLLLSPWPSWRILW
jgi:hypothetical protein